MFVKLSWIRSAQDDRSFKMIKRLGLDVFDVENPDDTDKKIGELIDSNYHTIIMSNELAGFSGDIIKKYNKDSNVNIIITPPRGEQDV